VCEYLESQGVYSEFSDKRYVVFMISLSTAESHLLRLEKALEEYVRKNGKVAQNAQNTDIFTHTPIRNAEYATAVSAPYELVDGKDAIGRISADNVGTFPPCYPVITAGEVFTQGIVDALTGNENVYGIKNGKFRVLI
jgi:arginine/lysine/ornithine decarboxylase